LQVAQEHRLTAVRTIAAAPFGPGVQRQAEELAADTVEDGYLAGAGGAYVVLAQYQDRTDRGDSAD
jgi:hypothetical protein